MLFVWWLKYFRFKCISNFTHCYYLCSVFSVHEERAYFEALFSHFFDRHVLVERDQMCAVRRLLLTWDPTVPQNNSTTFSEALESAVNMTRTSTPLYTHTHTQTPQQPFSNWHVKVKKLRKMQQKIFFSLILNNFIQK